MFKRSKVKLIAAVIDKAKHSAQYVTPSNPYFLAVQFVLERIHMMAGNASRGTEIVFEARGKAEDKIVSDWCQRVCEGENHRNDSFDFKISFAKKASNVVGLQMADLACQPIIHYVQKSMKASNGMSSNGIDEVSKSQLDKFQEAARELKAYDNPERFKEQTRKIVKAKPKPEKSA